MFSSVVCEFLNKHPGCRGIELRSNCDGVLPSARSRFIRALAAVFLNGMRSLRVKQVERARSWYGAADRHESSEWLLLAGC